MKRATFSDRNPIGKHLIVQKIRDEYMILNVKRGDYFTTDGAGSFILSRILARQTREQIEKAMQGKYAISAARASGDLKDFLNQLRRIH